MFKPIRIPKRSPWMTQYLVISALLKREVAVRFGDYKLGFFWMLFEPLLGVVAVGLLLGTAVSRTVPEIPYPFFVLHGMLLLKLLTGPMNTAINAVGSNQGLLVYPSVKPLDTFIARFLFQLIVTFFSCVLFCLIAFWMGVRFSLGSLHILSTCYLLTWLIGSGLGLIFGVASAYLRETDKILMVLQRPLIFISAVLFPSSAIPAHVREWLLLNPLVHTIELSRKALYPYYSTEGANLTYPTLFAIVVLSLGLTLFHGNKDKITER